MIHPDGSGDRNVIAGKIRGRDRTACRTARPRPGRYLSCPGENLCPITPRLRLCGCQLRAPSATLIGISRSSFYLLIARGEIPIAKVGNRTLILDDDLRTYLARQRVVVERLATE
jgi:excisionase family DNA binding protein